MAKCSISVFTIFTNLLSVLTPYSDPARRGLTKFCSYFIEKIKHFAFLFFDILSFIIPFNLLDMTSFDIGIYFNRTL